MTDPTLQKLVAHETASCSQPSQQIAGGTRNSEPKHNMMTLYHSALLNAPPASTSSKPPSSAPQSREPQSQKHADLLAFHGIKVRDFAYESRLPPVKAWYKPQIQPGIQSLKRTKTDTGETEDPVSASSAEPGNTAKKARLERVVTEPDVQSQTESQVSTTNIPVRARGFFNLDDFVPPESQSQEPYYQSQATGSPQSQPPVPDFDQDISQDTEPYIDTPLVTPHGSLQFVITDTSDIPTSQLDSAGSQPPLPDLLSYAQLALPRLKDKTGLTGALSPMSSLSSIVSNPQESPSSPPRPPPKPFPTSRRPTSHSLSPPQMRSSSPSVVSRTPAMPYDLRKRPTAAKSAQNQRKPTSRGKTRVRSPSRLASQKQPHSRLTHQKSLSPQQVRPIRRTAAS